VSGYCDERTDVVHKIHITYRPGGSIHRTAVAAGESSSGSAHTSDGEQKKPYINVQVRGPSPCCLMKTLLKFIDVYFDDLSDDEDDEVTRNRNTNYISADIGGVTTGLLENGYSTATWPRVGQGVRSSAGLRDQACDITFRTHGQRADVSMGSDCCGSVTTVGSRVNGDSITTIVDDSHEYGGREMYMICPKCILLRQVRQLQTQIVIFVVIIVVVICIAP